MHDPFKIRDFRERILRWYKIHGREFPWRNSSASNYQVIIAEILLQRTRAGVVAEFFSGFIYKYSSWRIISLTSIDQLQEDLKPIGLWKRRASSLQALAKEMVKRKGRFPNQREDIESLPGIGQYIANAVLMFYHHHPQPLLDTNMARVLERVFGPRKLADIRYDPYLQKLALEVVNTDNSKQINWAILDLAALICLPKKPDCIQCPILSICNYHRNQATNN